MKSNLILIILSLFLLSYSQDDRAFFIGANVNYPYDIPASESKISLSMGYSVFTEIEGLGDINLNFVLNNVQVSRKQGATIVDSANVQQGSIVLDKDYNFYLFGIEALYQAELFENFSLDAGFSMNFVISAQVEDSYSKSNYSKLANINNTNSPTFGGMMGASYRINDEFLVRALFNYSLTNLLKLDNTSINKNFHIHNARFFVSMFL